MVSVESELSASKKPQLVWSVLILLALLTGLALRLIGLSYPPFEFKAHHFRQCQTLSTIEAFYRDGIDVLHPRTLFMGYPGVFILEFPLFQALAAGVYRIFGPHIEIIRLLNICFGAASTWLLYRIAARILLRPQYLTSASSFPASPSSLFAPPLHLVPALAALTYWLAPLNIEYHRSILLDPSAVFFALTSFYTLLLLLDIENASGKCDWALLSVFAGATLVTTLIKVLYLFPAVLLLGRSLLLRRFRFDFGMVKIICAFGIAGLCFIAWNSYSTKINNQNLLSQGYSPTAHLGITALLNLDFYKLMLKTRPKLWLGLPGALFYVFGVWACWKWKLSWRNPLILLGAIPPGYLFVFANINYPHDYYQLIITPFLAVLSAVGLLWMYNCLSKKYSQTSSWRLIVPAGACVLLISSPLTYLGWFKMPRLDEHLLKIEKICAGKYEPWAPGMIFVNAAVNQLTNSAVPAYLYAARIWGYSLSPADLSSARTNYQEVRPAFPKLDYLALYGFEPGDWPSPDEFTLKLKDESQKFYLFQSRMAEQKTTNEH